MIFRAVLFLGVAMLLGGCAASEEVQQAKRAQDRAFIELSEVKQERDQYKTQTETRQHEIKAARIAIREVQVELEKARAEILRIRSELNVSLARQAQLEQTSAALADANAQINALKVEITELVKSHRDQLQNRDEQINRMQLDLAEAMQKVRTNLPATAPDNRP